MTFPVQTQEQTTQESSQMPWNSLEHGILVVHYKNSKMRLLIDYLFPPFTAHSTCNLKPTLRYFQMSHKLHPNF